MYLLTAALVLMIVAHVILMDRKDRRHDRHVAELLQWRHDPGNAAAAWTTSPELLYIPPEDDEAWNDQHRVAE